MILRIARGIWFRIKCLGQYIGSFIQFKYRAIKYKDTYQKLQAFKDKYKGQRCFLIGTGSSLTDEDILKLRDENTFSVNAFIKATERLDFYPTFYGFMNSDCMDLYGEEIVRNEKSTIFFARRDMKEDALLRIASKSNSYEIPMRDVGDWAYFLNKDRLNFSFDISKSVGWGYTVVFSMLQVIAYLGFSEIYLLGMDCCYPKGVSSFQDQRSEKEIKDGFHNGAVVDEYVYSYEAAKPYLEKKNIKVYNATRGGHLEVFPRVNLDEVICKH